LKRRRRWHHLFLFFLFRRKWWWHRCHFFLLCSFATKKTMITPLSSSLNTFSSSIIYSNVSPRWTQQKNEELRYAHGLQHFDGKGACCNFGIGIRKNDK
jgi:hypothetical protein